MSNHTDLDPVHAFWGKPSMNAFRGLSAAEFGRCVELVFARAGYEVKSRPLDLVTNVALDLYATDGSRRQVGAVVLRHVPDDQPVSGKWVRKLRLPASVRKTAIPVYLVSNGKFEPSHSNERDQEQQIYQLGAAQFCRYARYVRNSRFPAGIGLSVQIPPDLFAGEPWAQRKSKGANVLVLANNKGGVGKTTSTRQIALHMAKRGLRVLLVDLDPQGNLTEGLYVRQEIAPGRLLADAPNLVQYFTGQSTLRELVHPTAIDGQPISNVFLIPAHPDLSLLDTGGAGRPATEMRFARDLSDLVVSMPATN